MYKYETAAMGNGTETTENGAETKKIGTQDVIKATEILKKYKEGKVNLEKRIVENEQWWRLRHWEYFKERTKNETQPVSAWLFNSVANKHADAMDNYPEPNVLARAADDEETAAVLSKVLPTILEYNNYEQTYSDTWWYKLKQGTGVKGVFWNPDRENGLGDVDIKKIDLLNLFWEPGIADIQDSRNVFHISAVDSESLTEEYPELAESSYPTLDVAQYIHDDSIDTDKKSIMVDWYYRKNEGGRTVLHYVKYVGDKVLYASENDERYRYRGFYDHGLYPFVFDTLFVEEGTPYGFGYIDVMKSPEEYIDRLNACIMENALATCKKRYVVSENMGINEDDLSDYTKTVIKTPAGNLGENAMRELAGQPMGHVYNNVLQAKIEELKETSGNRDFSQGSTANGVTAAAAISALIEAGSKMSRDMIASGYRAFTKECCLVLELVRQFYTTPRCFRITGEGKGFGYAEFDNSSMIPQPQGEAFGETLGERLPVFDIKVSASKKATYSRMAQNELAIQLFNLGLFNPQMCDQALALLDIMDFDGKEKVVESVRKNGGMYEQLMQMQQMIIQMAQIIDRDNGTALTAQMAQIIDRDNGTALAAQMTQTWRQEQPGRTQAEKNAERARNAASVGGMA